MKRLWMVVVCAAMLTALAGCGGEKDDAQGKAENKTTEEAPATHEKVTEFEENEQKLSFSDIEMGINFKTTGTKVTISFEDINDFDNTMGMVFALTDANYEMETMEQEISEGKSAYTFENLKKGKDYYLEVYPTVVPESDEQSEELTEKNADCQLILKQ